MSYIELTSVSMSSVSQAPDLSPGTKSFLDHPEAVHVAGLASSIGRVAAFTSAIPYFLVSVGGVTVVQI